MLSLRKETTVISALHTTPHHTTPHHTTPVVTTPHLTIQLQHLARYWSECLAHGGGKPSHLLVADHLHQQEFQPRALAASLLRELDTKKVEVEEALRSGR